MSIDFSLPKLWQAWYRFRKGKHPSADIDAFAYLLETNLGSLSDALESGTYVHGLYQRVTITEHKRRDLAVAPVRDRVVHRLLYDELVRIFDHTFLYDVWSCRTNKGLLGAIERTQDFARRFSHSWVWRADITKFFDHVNQAVLKTCLRRRINDPNALWLLESVIDSYQSTRERERERES